MNFWFKTMRIYFSKVKDVGKEVEFTGVDLDDELRDILKEKKVWSNIALDDLFQSYLRKMSLVNHFSGRETERDMASIAKLRQLAKILREMLNVSCYYAVFE